MFKGKISGSSYSQKNASSLIVVSTWWGTSMLAKNFSEQQMQFSLTKSNKETDILSFHPSMETIHPIASFYMLNN